MRDAQLLFACGFSYKNFAGTGPIARLRGVLLQNPCRGTRCACFRDCARVFRGGCHSVFFARKRFLEVCATTFLVDRAGICPHIARRVIGTRGTRCAQNINALTVGTGGRSYGLGFRV